jgi:hypothetical protein
MLKGLEYCGYTKGFGLCKAMGERSWRFAVGILE